MFLQGAQHAYELGTRPCGCPSIRCSRPWNCSPSDTKVGRFPSSCGSSKSTASRGLWTSASRPASRKPGFSALPLFDALRKAGITYESDRALGNPEEIRTLWKNGDLREGKVRYRRLLRNGRRPRVELLLALSRHDRVCILCYEGDHELCHRTVIAEEAARLEPALVIRHL